MTLKMEVLYSSETSVSIYSATTRNAVKAISAVKTDDVVNLRAARDLETGNLFTSGVSVTFTRSYLVNGLYYCCLCSSVRG